MQGFAQQDFHLGVDRSQFGRRQLFHRLNDLGVHPDQEGPFLSARHDLAVKGACVDHRLGVAIAAKNHEQVGDHGRLPLIVQVNDVSLR